jgi:hypothetical protein
MTRDEAIDLGFVCRSLERVDTAAEEARAGRRVDLVALDMSFF